MIRWLRFNAIGILGAGVQLLVLKSLIAMGAQYLLATALAVETALLHNYFWHLRWTWQDRAPTSRRRTFVRFHLANGVISLLGNLALMRLLAGHMELPPVPANIIAITAMSVVNYALGDRWVFPPTRDAA